MARLVTAMVLTVFIVVFAMSNSHDVELSLVLGEPIEMRLFVLLTIAYVSGGVSAFFYRLIIDVNRRTERRKRLLKARQTALLKVEDA